MLTARGCPKPRDRSSDHQCRRGHKGENDRGAASPPDRFGSLGDCPLNTSFRLWLWKSGPCLNETNKIGVILSRHTRVT